MSGKAAPAVSLQGARAFLVAMACCAIPISGSAGAADLALRIATKPPRDAARQAPAPASGPPRGLFEEFLRWKRSLLPH
jgi:hypothetical protein